MIPRIQETFISSPSSGPITRILSVAIGSKLVVPKPTPSSDKWARAYRRLFRAMILSRFRSLHQANILITAIRDKQLWSCHSWIQLPSFSPVDCGETNAGSRRTRSTISSSKCIVIRRWRCIRRPVLTRPKCDWQRIGIIHCENQAILLHLED